MQDCYRGYVQMEYIGSKEAKERASTSCSLSDKRVMKRVAYNLK